MSYKTIFVEKIGRRARVALRRPETRNALSADMIGELRDAFQNDLALDGTLSAVELRGDGVSFCAGADLVYMQSMAAFTREENVADADALYAMLLAIRACPAPVVARVHGHAFGGAIGLVAACDAAFAENSTRFCLSEVRLGLAPAVISPFVLEKMRPASAARRMLAAEEFGASDAFDEGLLSARGLVGAAALDAAVEQWLCAIERCGPEAVRATKSLLRRAGGLPDRADLRTFTAQTIAERRASAEGQEGLRAFFEKRSPSWRRP